MQGRLEKSLWYLGWHFAAGAVMDVYRENQRREAREGNVHEAKADIWVSNDALRRDIHERACRHWCARTELDATCFPFSIDYVAILYFRYRKRNPEETDGFQREIDAASGEPVGRGLFDGTE